MDMARMEKNLIMRAATFKKKILSQGLFDKWKL